MKTVQSNIQDLEDALDKVKTHCMCLTFSETESHYLVIFPEGDFQVGGIRISKGMGKIKALKTLLDKMEYYWVSSFPGYVHN